MVPVLWPVTPDRPTGVLERAWGAVSRESLVRSWCTPLRPRHPLSGMSDPARAWTVGSEWTKTEAADEAAAEAMTEARVKCLMRCARIVAKPPRSRSNRTRQGLSTAEIVSQSAGRDGSSQERQQSVRTSFRSSSQPAVRLARSSSFFLLCKRQPRTNPISGGPAGTLHLDAT